MNRFLNTNDHIIYLKKNEITFDDLFNEDNIKIPKNVRSIKMNDIYNNNLEFLKNQTKLKSLILSHKFNNSISNISYCSNLTRLHFGYFFDNDISYLTHLKKLEILQLSERFTGCGDIISNLTCLKTLHLSRDMFPDDEEHNIDFLYKLTNLTEIDFGFRFNGNIDNLDKLSKLTKLVLGHKFNKPLITLCSLPNLTLFSLNKTFLGDYDLFSIKPKINEWRNNSIKLVLPSNYNQSIDFITRFKSITHLELGYNFNQDISYLTSLYNLNLIIFHNYNKSIDCLNSLPNLTSIQFKSNYIYPIKNFYNLTYLSLLHLNSINPKQLDMISNINLKYLELNYSLLTLNHKMDKIILDKLPINLIEFRLTGLLSIKFDIELIPITLNKIILGKIYEEEIIVNDFIYNYSI
jgi:hypothetical protein